jgi:hypothetical protein
MKIHTVSVPSYTRGVIASVLRAEPRRAGRIARTFAGLALVAASLLITSQPAAAQSTTYTYTGKPFAEEGCTTTSCSISYAAGDHVTATLTVPVRLGPNYSGILPPGSTLTMTDGHQTLGPTTLFPAGNIVDYSIATDGNGIPSAWALKICGNNLTGCITTYYGGLVANESVYPNYDLANYFNCPIECGALYAYGDTTPTSAATVGTWTATTTYSYLYRGHHFTTFKCGTGTDCTTPGVSGNPYTTSNSVTATLTLASPLSISNGPLQNVSSYPGFQLTISDGQVSDTEISGCSSCSAWVVVDTGGNIVAWYLQVPTGEGSAIYSLYDPSSATYPNGVINTLSDSTAYSRTGRNAHGVVDYGSGSFETGFQYAYDTGMPGAFGAGGTIADVSTCIGTSGKLCNPTGASEFSVAGPGATNSNLSFLTETQQLCVVPADPRGPNCGLDFSNPWKPKFPRPLAVKDIPQCAGFGNEVIPPYLCGASGPSGTGFALILGVAEQLNALNGIYTPFKQLVNNIPALQSTSNPTCDALPLSRVRAVAIGGTWSDSLTEEQTPEQANGRPLLTEVTTGCDPEPGPRGSGLPSHSIEGIGFKNLIDEPGPWRVLREVIFANTKYAALQTIAADTDFTSATSLSPIGNQGSTLKACVTRSQQLLNQGKYMCAAEQVYQCETLVDAQGVADYTVFKRTAAAPLRLPDLYGDWVRRLGNVFNTDNYIGITAGVSGMAQTIEWPLPHDPYPPTCP